MRSQKKYYILTAFWLCMAIAVALLIIHFTGEPASVSDQTSMGVLERILNFFGLNPTGAALDVSHRFIRKAAHFILFFAFGFNLRAAAQYQRFLPKIASPLTVSALFAIADEVRQGFIPGRAPMVKDVVIDFAGAALGVLAVTGFFCFIEWGKKRRERRAALEGEKIKSNERENIETKILK